MIDNKDLIQMLVNKIESIEEKLEGIEKRTLMLEKLVYKLSMIQMGSKYSVGFGDKEKYK